MKGSKSSHVCGMQRYTQERRGSKIIPPAKYAESRKIKELMHRSSNIREDMVSDLRTRILGEIYRVEADRVAEKIIQHGIYILGGLGDTGHYPL